MKAIILFIFFIFLAVPPVFGQIKIGDNPQNIDASSVLELESSSKVLVITRVTTLEMEAITPQRGGLVYNTDTECVNYYDGTQWVNLCDAVNFTITNDPIINGRSTIEITESAAGYNLEVAKNSILGDNIIDGGIGPDDIQDNSITQDKLAAESVGSSELRQNAVGSVEIRDGSIAPEDMANTIADQVLTTDENGIVQWEDTNDLFDLTFDKLDNTLTISRSTTPGVSTISLEALVGSDDQQLDLTGNILSIENDPNTVDLSTYLQQISINNRRITLTNGGFIDLPAGTVNTDNQTLTLTGNTLAITGGNNVNLNKYLDNTDEQQLSIAGNRISLTDGGFVDLPPGTVDTDEQQLSIVGNRISLTDGGFVDIPEGNLSLDDGFIFVGNAASEPTPVDVGGDVTMNNIGQFSIENNTIESNNIVNNTITLEDLNQNGAADGQVIKWDETLNAGLGAWTVANDIANGTGGNVNTDATLTGNGNTVDLGIADDAVTTIKILDDNVTPAKLEASATDGQILTTDGTDVIWADPAAGNVNTDATLIGNGNTVDLGIADDAVTTIKILDDNVTPAKIEASATDGQFLATNGANVEWQDLTNPANTGSILFSDGTGGIAENNNQLFWNQANDRLGIGTDSPGSKVQVIGQVQASSFSANPNGSQTSPPFRFINDANSGMFLANTSELGFTTNSVEKMRIIGNGNVGIGVTVPLENLHVADNIRTDGSFLSNDNVIGVPDYVFQKYFLGNSILNPSYEFNDLAEIEAFVKENNHLPGIQSAQAVKEQGFWNVSESSRVNLEKIEELFLHTIEQEKKIKELQKANTNMSSELEALKAQMEEIKTVLLEKQND